MSKSIGVQPKNVPLALMWAEEYKVLSTENYNTVFSESLNGLTGYKGIFGENFETTNGPQDEGADTTGGF